MEISTVKMAFLADKDHFVHSGIPDDLNHEIMIFTEGYSIENDAYRDGDLSTILSTSELVNYKNDVKKISTWYSLAMFRFLAGDESNLSLHPDHVFDAYDDLITLKEGEVYPEEFRAEIFTNYERLMRGKTLLALLVKHASYKGREVRHHTKALLEMVAARPGPLISKLFDRVSERFAA
ncbi:hypothetical protein DGN21_20375 [Xanthomonas sp. MLO165]|nr:hypothetical protein DGN21_20375 [Xanthomonas sp. MLO165]